MRVLIIGSSGQVGSELMRTAWPFGTTISGVTRPQIDITDERAVERLIGGAGYDLTINAAGYTAVDRAEADQAQAFAVNRDGAAHVAAACARAGSALVHLSTDYVFDGTKRGAYVEDDPISPINVYGASKAAGEAAVRASLRRHLILRTSWVYGARGQNFVKTMLRLARQQKDIAVVDDQTGSPTAATDLAAAIVQISKRLFGIAEPWGTYHLCGTGAVTWHGFAQAVMSLRKGRPADRPTLRPIDSHGFAAAARRPTNSRLDCRRAAATFGVACPAWHTSLARLLPEIEAHLSAAFAFLLVN